MITAEKNPDRDEARGLEIVRDGKGAYVARNARGGELRIAVAGTPDSFTPGELLQLATSMCAALSADHVLGSLLGHDFAATVKVDADSDKESNRLTELRTRIEADMSPLAPERHEALIARAERAIDRICIVGRSVDHGTPVRVEVVDAAESPAVDG